VSLVALEIPKVGLVMESARLVRWLKNVGDVVKQGEPLLELETEKSVVEIESTESGRLVEILLQADQEARVGDRVAWLENEPNAAATGASGAGAPSSRGTGTAGAQMVSGASGASGRGHSSGAIQHGASGRIKSSPVARRWAAEHSIDLRQVAPTGPRGRVQLSDVRREIEARGEQRGPSAQAQAQASTSMDPQAAQASRSMDPQERAMHAMGPQQSRAMPSTGPQPLSSMRRAVARSMTLSNATIPQFIVERAVDWTTLHAIRAKVTAELPSGAAKPSVNDFLLQGIARTLLAFPQLNATFTGDANSSDAALLPATGTHIGLVVAVENGLLVPVLHDVDRIGIMDLARRRNETVQRAASGKLKREELEGATFSLSNLGARGPDRFTAIISPPQSAILAVGRQRDCVVAINGGIHVRPISQLTLTVDHRVADGRLAADFLAALVEILEGNHWRLN
jgi:pyruvate dehydrogenase E2 component (dihydrolipoamide acetyltransferase)